MKQVSTLLLILLVPVGLLAQQQTNLDIALRYLESQSKEWGLTPADLSDLAVNNEYQTVTNGVTHLYLIQRHQGIEVYNARMGRSSLPVIDWYRTWPTRSMPPSRPSAPRLPWRRP